MKYLCDMHTHSIFSDGSWTPEQLIDEGERIGLAAMALTDHNTVSGLPRFLAAAEGKKIRAVPGIEVTTEYHGTELHIVGLGIKGQHYAPLTELLEDYLVRKEGSNRDLVDALNRDGYGLDYDTIKKNAGGGYVNRAHIAAELTRLGKTPSVKAAFSLLLRPECGYYNPIRRLDALMVVEFLRHMGIIPVWAHPFLSMKEPEISEFLSEAVPAGLVAMETNYSTYHQETTQRAHELVEQFSILPSGGSDFHGDKKPDIQIGTGRGDLAVPYEYLLHMEQAVYSGGEN